MDHLVNNVSCKNPRINGRLAPVIQNMFVVYQREIIELLIDDLLAEEVKVQNDLENIGQQNRDIIREAVLKND